MSVQKLIWQCSPYNLYKLQIQDFIIEKIVSLQVKSLPDLLQSSSIIGSAIQETETVSFNSLVSKIKIERGYTCGKRKPCCGKRRSIEQGILLSWFL